jgi:hypothetical protein
MHGISLRDPQVYGTVAAVAICLGAVTTWLLLRKKPTPEELEFARRDELVRAGRIIDGTVLDIADLDAEQSGREGGMQLILYKYEIAGVVYECSQDVTTLRDYINIHETRLGFPCSVRYNIHQPANSIIVAENWTGLRDSAFGVPIRRGMPPRRNSRATSL